jgi:DNA-binding transcriptional MerR regulator
MLKIGDFPKIAQVNIKTLRYYDRLGLLTSTDSAVIVIMNSLNG